MREVGWRKAGGPCVASDLFALCRDRAQKHRAFHPLLYNDAKQRPPPLSSHEVCMLLAHLPR